MSAVRRFMASLCLTAALVAATTSCGDSSNTENLVLPEKNIDQWVMPLDQYQLPGVSKVPREAWMIEMTGCMRDKGYDAPQVDLSQVADPDPTKNAVGEKLPTVAVASTYGFHDGSELPGGYVEDAGDVMSQRLETWGQAGMDAFDDCSSDYDRLLDVTRDESDENSANWLASDAGQAAVDSGELDAEAQEWERCMKPFGYPGLTSDPNEFPSSELLEDLGSRNFVDEDPVASLPSAAEIEAATNNVKCLDSSGYLHKKYDLEWDEQVKLLKANKSHLDEEKERQEKLIAEAQKIVDAA